ncbi:MAG: Uma2 family endonuclease [Anaerolineae bacterium]
MIVHEKRYTLDEFHVFSEAPENKNRLLELINGEIVEKVASFKPSRLALRMGHLLSIYLDQNDIGYVTGADGSYILAPGYEFMPDVGYISKARLPQEPERQVQGPPDLAVEVKSPTDSKREMRQKAEDYLRFGTKMVWLIFPEEKLVEVYVPDKDVAEININGVLDGGEVLPGFTLPVKEIFPA